MRIAFLIFIIIHGLIHSLGFLKAYGITVIKKLEFPISKSFGLIWLLCTILFFIYSVSHFVLNKYSWIIGLIAVIFSQLLFIGFWKDTKFGTIPNAIILLVVLFSFASYYFKKNIAHETTQILSKVSKSDSKIISKQDFTHLPIAIQKWITTTGIIGKPEIKSGLIKQKALMKMKPDQKNWYSAEAIQYSTTENPAFIWTVEMNMIPGIQIKGRDKFVDGNGEMLIKLNSLINVVDEKGENLNEGTIQRFLGEVVWFPSLALSPYIHWETIDEFSTKATMNYMETKGSGVFYFNKEGDFVKFIAMRFMENKPDAKHFPWVLTVEEYSEFEGIRVPSKMKATWKLDTGDWTWLELEILDIKYNNKIIDVIWD